MQQITLNVGLNVGTTEPGDQLNQTLGLLADRCQIEAVKITVGEWNGQRERCAVVTVRQWRVANPLNVALLCRELKQDAIAVSFGGDSPVLYMPDGSTQPGDSAVFQFDLDSVVWSPE